MCDVSATTRSTTAALHLPQRRRRRRDDGDAAVVVAAVATRGAAAQTSRSSQLFEEAVYLPLTAAQERVVQQLDWTKRWYLLCHAAYIALVALVGTAVLLLLLLLLPSQHPRIASSSSSTTAPHETVTFVDVLLIAMSAVCNCGLQSVDTTEWGSAATAVLYVLMFAGGVVVTSAYQPLLRLFMLYRVRDVFAVNAHDTPAQRALRARKRRHARRLVYTSAVCALTPLVYVLVVHLVVTCALLLLNTSQLTPRQALALTAASFHGCVFASLQPYARDAAVVGLVLAACVLGFTGFPVVLRAFVLLERAVLRACDALAAATLRARRQGRAASDVGTSNNYNNNNVVDNDDVDGDDESSSRHALLLHDTEAQLYDDDDDTRASHGRVFDVNERSSWLGGFDDVLAAAHPGVHHPFLFTREETAYLACAWLALTAVQAAPLLLQQQHSDGVLADYDAAYRLYLALCQAGVVRFAAVQFVPLVDCTLMHVALTMLAMYIPALPIATDRTFRKWRQLFRTALVRLLTSRLFWLFASFMVVLAAEEAALHAAVAHTRFDLMTRTLFEVVSAYAGCGLSLTLPSAGANVSFVGSCGTVSKLVITAVLFGGRHRFVDLGIDLGFAELQRDVRRRRAYLHSSADDAHNDHVSNDDGDEGEDTAIA